MDNKFILIELTEYGKLSVSKFQSIGQMHERFAGRLFRELKKDHVEQGAIQIIRDQTNRAIELNRKR